MRNFQEAKIQEGVRLDPAIFEPYATPKDDYKDTFRTLLSDAAEMEKPHSKALVMGRFQPVHVGHLWLMVQALQYADKIIVAIGSANVRNKDNPLSPQFRELLVRSATEKIGIAEFISDIVYVDDHPNDKAWLDMTIAKTGDVDVAVGHNNWVNGIFRKDTKYNVAVVEPPMLDRHEFRGEFIRAKLRSQGIPL